HDSGAWTNPVSVILLDTGVHTDYACIPEKFDSTRALNLYDDPSEPRKWSLHGTSTTSILGGGGIQGDCKQFFPTSAPGKFEAYVGGDPWADITTFRIHESVVHLGSKTMALGLRKAAEKGADVISISHGGFPLLSWAKAVDYAYEKGS